MKHILFLLLLSSCLVVQSQCFLAMDELDQINESDIRNESVHLDESVDRVLREEFDKICQVFGVTASLQYYKEPGRSNAFAKCSNEEYAVFIGEALVKQEWNAYAFENTGIIGCIAHEVSHLYLCKMGYTGNATENELLADFMAGYVLALRSIFRPTNIFKFSQTLYSMGDSEFTDKDHHGLPEERVKFMTLGCSHGGLNVRQAYEVGQKWIDGTVGVFNLNGLWQSTSGNSFNVSHYNNWGQEGILCSGIAVTYTAGRIGNNNFRANFLDRFGQLTGFMDFLVISSSEMIVTVWPGGESVIWTK